MHLDAVVYSTFTELLTGMLTPANYSELVFLPKMKFHADVEVSRIVYNRRWHGIGREGLVEGSDSHLITCRAISIPTQAPIPLLHSNKGVNAERRTWYRPNSGQDADDEQGKNGGRMVEDTGEVSGDTGGVTNDVENEVNIVLQSLLPGLTRQQLRIPFCEYWHRESFFQDSEWRSSIDLCFGAVCLLLGCQSVNLTSCSSNVSHMYVCPVAFLGCYQFASLFSILAEMLADVRLVGADAIVFLIAVPAQVWSRCCDVVFYFVIDIFPRIVHVASSGRSITRVILD